MVSLITVHESCFLDSERSGKRLGFFFISSRVATMSHETVNYTQNELLDKQTTSHISA